MDGMGKKFLSGTAFTDYEGRLIYLCKLFAPVNYFLSFLVGMDDIVKSVFGCIAFFVI